MKVKILFVFFLIVLSVISNFGYIPDVSGGEIAIPPTKAIERIVTGNGSVIAKNYSSPVYFVGLGVINITSNNAKNTIYFSSSGSNSSSSGGANVTSITCGQNQFVNEIINSTGFTRCSYPSIHASNLFSSGGSGAGIATTNLNQTQVQFKSITGTSPITISVNASNINISYTGSTVPGGENTTTVNLGHGLNITTNLPTQIGGPINLKSFGNTTKIFMIGNTTMIEAMLNGTIPNGTCLASQKVLAIDGQTGVVTCATDQTGITSAFGHNNDNAPITVYTGTTGTQQLNFNTLSNGYGLVWSFNGSNNKISLNFKSNNDTCSTPGQFFNSLNNNTGYHGCATPVNTAQIGNSGNGFSWFGSRPNATQNLLKTLRCLTGLSCSSNSTDVSITNTVTDTNTAQGTNLGTHGIGIYSGNANATQLQFLKLLCDTGLYCSENSTNTIIKNPTGVAFNQTQSNGTVIANNTHILNFINDTKIQLIIKKSKDQNGVADQRVNITATCPTCGTLSSAITSINSQTGPAVNIVRTPGNTTITNTTNQIQVNIGWNVPILSGSQTFTGHNTWTSAFSNFTKGLTVSDSKKLILDGSGLDYLDASGHSIFFFTNGAQGLRITTTDNEFNLPLSFFQTGQTVSRATNVPEASYNIGATGEMDLIGSNGFAPAIKVYTKGAASSGGNFKSYLQGIIGNQTSFTAINATSDANAKPPNHMCTWYFVTGNSTFRNICNFNGVIHIIGKG